MPGDYMHPHYEFTNQWLRFVQERRARAAQAPSGSSGPGPNLGGPDVAMSSPTILLKVVTTAGGTWTPAPRAVTIAPVSLVDNPLVAPIQQVAAETSKPVQSAFVTVSASGQQQPQPLSVQLVTSQSESHSVVPFTVGSSSFIPVSTLSVTLSSSTSISGIPGSTLYRPIFASTGRFSIGTS